jgi:lipoprotein NlpI
MSIQRGSCGKIRRLLSISLVAFFATTGPITATPKPVVEDALNRCDESANLEMTISYCTQAIESGRLSGKRLAFAFYKRGNAYNAKREYASAVRDYDEAIRLNPRHANTFSNRGVALGGKREYDRAIESYTEAIRLNPNHADAFANRGVAYAAKRDYDQAIQDYNEALRLNPHHANGFFNRGNAYRRKRDYDRAIADYNRSLEMHPTAQAFSNRGIAYSRKEEHELAIQSYNEALRLTPRHLNALYNRGNAYTRMGEYARAIADFDRVLELRPNHANAYSSRGIVRFFQGQFSAAVPDFSAALRHAPGNLYGALLLYVAQARAGDHGPELLLHAAEGFDLAKWPGPIVSLYLGKLTEQNVLEAIAETDMASRGQRHCQAYFYIAQHLLAQQQRMAAARMLEKAVATNAALLFEHQAAQVELKRLGN